MNEDFIEEQKEFIRRIEEQVRLIIECSKMTEEFMKEFRNISMSAYSALLTTTALINEVKTNLEKKERENERASY
ncbi:MAG: hypothetical protein LBQ37_02665 [Elusimicrobiota bacterium]|jgi:hypothetical protein|nr:hypothetical protein [Elusimicrobiota bacterium]